MPPLLLPLVSDTQRESGGHLKGRDQLSILIRSSELRRDMILVCTCACVCHVSDLEFWKATSLWSEYKRQSSLIKKKKCTVKCTVLKTTTNHTSWEREKKKEHSRVCECLLFISLETLRSSKGSFEVAFSLIPVFVTAWWEPASCQVHVEDGNLLK